MMAVGPHVGELGHVAVGDTAGGPFEFVALLYLLGLLLFALPFVLLALILLLFSFSLFNPSYF